MKNPFKKSNYFAPAFYALENGNLLVHGGTVLEGSKLPKEVKLPKSLPPGTDFQIRMSGGIPRAVKFDGKSIRAAIGGFHVGLDGRIAVHTIWDRVFRPNCADPRGMCFVPGFGWQDIYLLNTDPDQYGTSSAGKQIADGRSHINGKPLTWWVAVDTLARFGKTLLSRAEFTAGMQGSKESKTCGSDPVTTGHVPGLKSVYGAEQATGCMWTWSRDIKDVSGPWVYIMGGSWSSGAPGPRRFLSDVPVDDWDSIGARGRCDHLVPGSEAKA